MDSVRESFDASVPLREFCDLRGDAFPFRMMGRSLRLIVVAFALLAALLLAALPAQGAWALSPSFKFDSGSQFSDGQTGVSADLGTIAVYFGHNVAATSIFDENATHFSVVDDEGNPVAVTVYRKYFGDMAPNAQNPDREGYRRYLYVQLPVLVTGTTYTLTVSAGVKSEGNHNYDAATLTFTTEGEKPQPQEPEEDKGEQPAIPGASDSGSGTGSSSYAQTDGPAAVGAGEGGSAALDSGTGAAANVVAAVQDADAEAPVEAQSPLAAVSRLILHSSLAGASGQGNTEADAPSSEVSVKSTLVPIVWALALLVLLAGAGRQRLGRALGESSPSRFAAKKGDKRTVLLSPQRAESDEADVRPKQKGDKRTVLLSPRE